MKYETMLGPNTNQWWVYDNETDEYIDPPAELLHMVKKYSYDTDKQKEFLDTIVGRNPIWLYDEEYRYTDIEI